MNQREKQALDRHITGNYGEDQFVGELTDEQVEKLIEVHPDIVETLYKISALPTHPCDDARNVAALEVAKREASALLAKLPR